jgi:hypothetical protein
MRSKAATKTFALVGAGSLPEKKRLIVSVTDILRFVWLMITNVWLVSVARR